MELVGVLSDAAVLSIDDAAEQVIEGRRATARITADPQEHRAAERPVAGDFGPVEMVE